MAQGKFIAYYRVSTKRQGVSGLGLEAQQEAVRSYLNGGNWQLLAEVVEVESGKRNDRPKLTEALKLCRLHKATLIIAKMDRLARNVAFISALMESGVEFTAVDFPDANRLTVHILAAVAEHEANAISERTKAALARKREFYAKLTDEERDALKAAGKATQLGNAKGVGNVMTEAHRVKAAAAKKAKADERAHLLSDVLAEIRAGGASSLREIAAALNERGIPTARGGLWSAVQVSRVLARAA